jgi:hypothetical protein
MSNVGFISAICSPLWSLIQSINNERAWSVAFRRPVVPPECPECVCEEPCGFKGRSGFKGSYSIEEVGLKVVIAYRHIISGFNRYFIGIEEGLIVSLIVGLIGRYTLYLGWGQNCCGSASA